MSFGLKTWHSKFTQVIAVAQALRQRNISVLILCYLMYSAGLSRLQEKKLSDLYKFVSVFTETVTNVTKYPKDS